MQEHLADFEQRGTQLWVISTDDPKKLAAYAEKHGFGFPMLTDPGAETIKAYGILNEKNGKIPHPTAVVVDESGCITYLRTDVQYSQRPPIDELLAAIDAGGCVAE